MRKLTIIILVLLLSQQYLSAQNITKFYSLPNIGDKQTQKIMVRPTNPREQVILSREQNKSFFFLIPADRSDTVKYVEIDTEFEVHDFDLYGDTIIFCGRKINNALGDGFFGVATFQTLFNSNPSWIPIVDNNIRLLEKIQLYRENNSLYAACYAGHYAVIYEYNGNFSTIGFWRYKLGDYQNPYTPDNVVATSLAITETSVLYLGYDQDNYNTKLFKIERGVSNTSTMDRIVVFPSSYGIGGVIEQMNKDTVIIAVADWSSFDTYVYRMDINNLYNISRQRLSGYHNKTFPIDIVYNSTEKKILFLNQSSLNAFQPNRRDALYELEAFPSGSYNAKVVYDPTIPYENFVYNSIDLISRNKAIVCGSNCDYNNRNILFFEQTINRMSNATTCLKNTTELAYVSTINLYTQPFGIIFVNGITNTLTTRSGAFYIDFLNTNCQQ